MKVTHKEIRLHPIGDDRWVAHAVVHGRQIAMIGEDPLTAVAMAYHAMGRWKLWGVVEVLRLSRMLTETLWTSFFERFVEIENEEAPPDPLPQGMPALGPPAAPAPVASLLPQGIPGWAVDLERLYTSRRVEVVILARSRAQTVVELRLHTGQTRSFVAADAYEAISRALVVLEGWDA